MSIARTSAVIEGRRFVPSYAQESLWLLDSMAQNRSAYNESLAFRITGPLRADALHAALHHAVRRHEALRTVFVESPDGLRAVVRDGTAEFVTVTDLTHLDEPTARREAQELVDAAQRRPFDLAEGPLLRAVVALLPGSTSVFALTVHHLNADGWSLGLVLDDVSREYAALTGPADRPAGLAEPAAEPAPAARFSDFARDLRRAYEDGTFHDKVAYWKRALADGPELLKLPLDRARPPVMTHNGATASLTVPRGTLKALTDLALRETGATESTVLLCAYAALLHRYSGQDRLTVGTTVLNRTDADHLATVGYFTNTVALGFDFPDDGLTFRELLTRTGDAAFDMMDHQDAPYAKVLESLDVAHDPSHSPVFQTMLTVLGRRKSLDLGEGTVCRPVPVARTAAKFDLLLYVSQDEDTVEFELEYATDLFEAGTADRILGHYAHLLGQLAADLDADVREVSILPAAERALILDQWNDTRQDYPDTTVIDRIEAQTAATPDAVAVEFRDERLTYAELHRLTNRVAHALLDRATAGSGFVGVYMERSVDMVVALLSVVKAGLAYVPIDPEYPADRVRYMIEDSGVPLVLTQARHRDDLADTGTEAVVLADLVPTATDESDVRRTLTPDSRVYMIYTSGSTGRPKGVVNRHVSLFNRLHWMQQQYGLQDDDRVLQKTPFSFDVSVWEFFWPLMYGARIVVAEPGGHRDTEYLKQLIRDRRITTTHFVPSMLNVFLEEDDLAGHTASLRRVFCSGEALPHHTVASFSAQLSCDLHNLYGPTEAAIDVSYWPATPDYPGRVVPIGRPIANTTLYVVDRNLRLQPVGVPGELCIGGVGLAEGYHNRPDLTEKAFVPDPFAADPGARLYRTGDLARYLTDGQIEYLGRIDNQIKLRGFRIELGEIEAVVQSLPTVREAAVVLHETPSSRMLVGYVVPADGFAVAEAKELMRKQLPDFMVPQLFVEIAAVPTSANGKLDRRALPDPLPHAAGQDQQGAAPAPLTTTHEHRLAAVWREVLGSPQVGADSNFFRLGGDSILSIRIAVRLRELGYRVTVGEVFEHPTISRLARHLAAGADSPAEETAPAQEPFALLDPADRGLLPDGTEDAWPLGRLQSGMIYHSMLHPESSVYHDIFSYDVRAPLEPELLRQAVRAVAAHHPQLRSSFDLASYSEPLQLVSREPAAELSTADVSALPAAEQDAEIARWVEEEKHRPFDLERAPLTRFQAHQRSAGTFTLTIAFHHAILDGWSVALVIEGVRRRYAALLAGAPAATATEGEDEGQSGGASEGASEGEQVPYSVFVALERAAVRDAGQARFWQDRVAGARPTLLVGTESGTVAESGTGTGTGTGDPADARPASRELTLPEPEVAAVQSLARDLGIPPRSVFLGLHLHVLGRLSGRTDVVTGLVVNGRPEVRGGEDLAGLFLNTVPFRADVATGDWPALFGSVFGHEQDAVAHRRFPLAEVLKRSGHAELFDTVFNYTDFHVYRTAPDDAVRITGARYFEQTSFPVVVHVHRDHFTGRMTLHVNYDAAGTDGNLISRYLDAYTEALTAAVGVGRPAPATTAQDGGRVPARAARPVDGTVDGPVDGPVESPVEERQASAGDGGPLERRIGGIVAQALGTEQVGPDDDYLEYGLDSISAIRVVARIKKLGVRITLQDVFQHRTIRNLAGHLAAGSEAEAEAVAEAAAFADRAGTVPFALAGAPARDFAPGVVDAYPATALQLLMVHRHDADPAQAVYHDVFSYHLEAPLREDLLRETLRRLVAAHETLRTSLLLDARPVPLQLVHAEVPVHLEVHDPGDVPEARREADFRDWFEAEKAVGFDWTAAPLMRFHAHRRGPGAFTLTLSFHHAVIDGWSLSLLVGEVVRLYAAALASGVVPETHRPALNYRDYAAAETASRHDERSRAFWLDELRDAPVRVLPHPVPDEPSVPDEPVARWSEVKTVLDPDVQRGVTALARRAGVPLKHALLAAHLVVLGLLGASDRDRDSDSDSGRDGHGESDGGRDRSDVTTALFTGGRLEEEGAEEVLGLFLNFPPFRMDLSGPLTWPDLLARTFAADRRALPHRRFPVGDLQDALGRDPSPETAFNYTRFAAYADIARTDEPVGDGGDGGARRLLTGVDWFEHTHFALLANVGHDLHQDRLILTLNADGRVLPQRWVEHLAGLYEAVLARMAADDSGQVNEWPHRAAALKPLLLNGK